MPKFKPVYCLLIDEWAGFVLSDPLFEIGMVLTPLLSQQAPLLLLHKHAMLLDTTTGPASAVTEYWNDILCDSGSCSVIQTGKERFEAQI